MLASEQSERMASAMKAAGLTQAQVAETVGVSQPAVSRWLKGGGIARDKLALLAGALDVDVEWIEFGSGQGPISSSEVEDAAWVWRPEPADGGRDYGNANVWSFTPTLETLTREALQNILDAGRDATVGVTFRIIRVTDGALDRFKSALRWDDLEQHLRAAAGDGQKLGHLIDYGLSLIEESGQLLLLAIEDSGTVGLVGDEFGSGNFAALTRNNLDSQKTRPTAGGAFGLGKAVFWRTSLISTVLFHSHLSADGADGRRWGRLIGRSELPWHSVRDRRFAGPGWFGRRVEDRAESFWEVPSLANDLHLGRKDRRVGTTVLVVGFHDPNSETTQDPRDLAGQIEAAAGLYFWPAIEDGRLKVTIETSENGLPSSSVEVDVKRLQPAFVDAVRTYRDGLGVDTLRDEGDVAVRSVPIRIPERQAREAPHGALVHDARLIVRRADDGDEQVDQLALYRGAGMVVKYVSLKGLRVGARPVHAVALCGEAASDDMAARAAEIFFRTAEPPQHHDWTVTPELKADYAPGYRKGIEDFVRELKRTVAELVTPPVRNLEDGPRALRELFRIGSEPPESGRPRVAEPNAWIDEDGRWNVEGVVRLKPGSGRWVVRPVVVFAAETGSGTPVPWSEFDVVDGDATVEQRRGSLNRAIAIPDGVRAVRFVGVADPGAYPVPAVESSIVIDLRRMERMQTEVAS